MTETLNSSARFKEQLSLKEFNRPLKTFDGRFLTIFKFKE